MSSHLKGRGEQELLYGAYEQECCCNVISPPLDNCMVKEDKRQPKPPKNSVDLHLVIPFNTLNFPALLQIQMYMTPVFYIVVINLWIYKNPINVDNIILKSANSINKNSYNLVYASFYRQLITYLSVYLLLWCCWLGPTAGLQKYLAKSSLCVSDCLVYHGR